MTKQLFAFIQFNGDNRSFCNQNCPYCYGREIRTGDHYWNGRIDLWEEGLERLHRDIYGVFSYGECMGSKGFYEMVDTFGLHQTWTLNIITNLSYNPTRLLCTKLAQDKRLFVTATWHPLGVKNLDASWERFKHNLLLLKAAGIPLQVMMVWYKPQMHLYPKYFEWFDQNNIRISVRRYVKDHFTTKIPFAKRLPWFAGKVKLETYTDAEKAYLYASTCPKVIEYGLNLASPKGRTCHAGKDMILVRHDGTVTLCAGLCGNPYKMGNLFDRDFKLNTEPIKCPNNSCGGDFGMLVLEDDRFGPLPEQLERDTFISQIEGIPQNTSPVAYPKRSEMLATLERLKLEVK